MVVCWVFEPATPFAVCEAVIVPMTERVPVEFWNAPKPPFDPPVQFPVMLKVPVELFCAAFADEPVPPLQFPVILTIPVEKLFIAPALVPDPLVQFPVMFRVPLMNF